MQTRSGDEKAVCLSVRPSVKRLYCGRMEERSVRIFNHTKYHLAYFSLRRRMVGEATPST